MTGSSSLGVEHLEGIPPSRIQESCKVIDHLHVFFEQQSIACLSLCIRTVEPALSVWHALMSSIYRSTTTAFVCEPKVPSAFSTSPSPLLPRRNTFNQSFINMTCCFFHADLEALELVITGLITAGGGPCRWGGKDDAVKLELRFGWASVVSRRACPGQGFQTNPRQLLLFLRVLSTRAQATQHSGCCIWRSYPQYPRKQGPGRWRRRKASYQSSGFSFFSRLWHLCLQIFA